MESLSFSTKFAKTQALFLGEGRFFIKGRENALILRENIVQYIMTVNCRIMGSYPKKSKSKISGKINHRSF